MGWTEKSSQLEDEKEGTKKLKHVILAEFATARLRRRDIRRTVYLTLQNKEMDGI
jgi:hypothetical protein